MPDASSNSQVIVCVNEGDAFDIDMVNGEFIIVLPLTLILDARGICGRSTEYPYLVLLTA